jgi:hypothetical protein
LMAKLVLRGFLLTTTPLRYALRSNSQLDLRLWGAYATMKAAHPS